MIEIFKKKCFVCGSVSENSYPLCDLCTPKPLDSNLVCTKCGLPTSKFVKTCRQCQDIEYSFKKNYSFYLYLGIPKEILTQYKFKKDTSFSKLYSKMIGDYIDKNFTNYIISIIPTSPIKRKINNGYQMDHIEKELRLLGYPIKQLLKKRYGKNQKKLNKEDRNKNLENRYYLKKNVTDRFENIILIDDVFTTGATINTVSKLLEVFGSIYSITLYRD